jgi:hypothetical protein
MSPIGEIKMNLRIEHVRVDGEGREELVAIYPFGTDMAEILLSRDESVVVRDENNRDYLVVARQE